MMEDEGSIVSTVTLLSLSGVNAALPDTGRVGQTETCSHSSDTTTTQSCTFSPLCGLSAIGPFAGGFGRIGVLLFVAVIAYLVYRGRKQLNRI